MKDDIKGSKPKETTLIKSIIGMLLITILSSVWIYTAVMLWNGKISIPNTTYDIFTDWFDSGRLNRANNILNAKYLLLVPPVLLGYFLFSMFGRVKLYFDSNLKNMALAGVIAVILEFSYAVIFDIQSGYTVLFIIIIELLLVIGSVYIPSVIRNYKQIFNGKEIAKSIYRYVLCIVLAFLISAAYGLALRILTEFQKDAVYKIINSFSFQYSKSSGIFGALIMAPFVEEMAFRGLMFGKFKNFIPVWAAAIFSALLFGIWHQNLPQFCGTVPMGLVIAFLYHQTGRLRYAMICHSVSNLFIGLAIANESSFLPVIPFFKTIFENIFALPIYVCIILIALVTISVFFILWRMLNFNSDKE